MADLNPNILINILNVKNADSMDKNIDSTLGCTQ